MLNVSFNVRENYVMKKYGISFLITTLLVINTSYAIDARGNVEQSLKRSAAVAELSDEQSSKTKKYSYEKLSPAQQLFH